MVLILSYSLSVLRCEMVVFNHGFCYFLSKLFHVQISLLIPGVNQLPKTILDILDSQPFYRVEKLPLVKLVDVEFIEAFVKKGMQYTHLTLISNSGLG